MSQETAPNEQPAANARKHSGCLTAFLALALVGNALFALSTWALVFSAPSSMVPEVVILGLLYLAAVVFAIAIYKWKKWGVIGYVSVIGVSILISIGTGNIGSALAGFIPIALLAFLVRSSWKQME
jgi:hypothetical protein